MPEILVLDSGPVGDLCGDPSRDRAIAAWGRLAAALSRGDVILPEIADYEVRRELQMRRASRSLTRLDRLKSRFVYDPLTTEIMRKAAEFWGDLRRGAGPRPTATPSTPT